MESSPPERPRTTRFAPHVLEPPGEAGGLDREDLAAALVEGGGVGGDEGVGVHGPDEPVGLRGGHGRQGDRAVGGARAVDGVGEGRLAGALDPQALDVHVGHHEVAVAPEALALGEEDAVLRDQQVPPEDEVGRATRGRPRWRRRRRRACGPTAGGRAPGGTRPWPRRRSRPRG